MTGKLNRRTRSISTENPTGEAGMGGRCTIENGSAGSCARDLGIGWKVNPFLVAEPGQTLVLADISGSGIINHMWFAGPAPRY